MECSQCGYIMDAFDEECPKCHGAGLSPNKPATPVESPDMVDRALKAVTTTVQSMKAQRLQAQRAQAQRAKQPRPTAAQAFQIGFEAGSTAVEAEKAKALLQQRITEAKAARALHRRLLEEFGENDPLTQEAQRRAEAAPGAVTAAQLDYLTAVEKAAEAKRRSEER